MEREVYVGKKPSFPRGCWKKLVEGKEDGKIPKDDARGVEGHLERGVQLRILGCII